MNVTTNRAGPPPQPPPPITSVTIELTAEEAEDLLAFLREPADWTMAEARRSHGKIVYPMIEGLKELPGGLLP